MSFVEPRDYIITRKRKKYRFALFANSPLCFELEAWSPGVADVLEVGAGTGLFSVELATRYPDKQFVAVDVKADRLQKGAREAETRGLTNIRFLRARADQLAECFGLGSLEQIWVTFPDPFPKNRSAKHRLTHPQFLALYRQLLSAGGSLYFKTDAPELFHWSLEQLVADGWSLKDLSFDLHDSILDQLYKIPTTYEARFMNEGLRIGFVRATPPVR